MRKTITLDLGETNELDQFLDEYVLDEMRGAINDLDLSETTIAHMQKLLDKTKRHFRSQIVETEKADAESVIRCKECIYYDPPHIENDGQRYEYSDMPPEAFDPITKEYVSSSYGINIGGRCCRDYECGYSEDKRVFVPETNYCGRAERKEE